MVYNIIKSDNFSYRGSLMKKILIMSGLFLISTASCFAYLNESTSSDVETLRAQGFSENMLRVIDLANEKNKGINGNYVRHFQPKNQSKKLGAYSKVKIYFDPTQDDGLFGEHQINFSNSWMGDENSYSSPLQEKQVVEDL